MPTFISTAAVGLLLIIMGAINMTGNISSLHSYHRRRVRDEDKKPLGRRVGVGSILCGLACIVFGVTQLAFEQTGSATYTVIGTAVLLAGIGVGGVVMIAAIMKYNKGLF